MRALQTAASVALILCAAPAQDGRNSPAYNAQVHPEIPIFDVLHIQGHVALEGWIPARSNLPQSCDPRGYIQPAKMIEVVTLKIIQSMWARPDQAHLSSQYVAELW